MLVLRLIPSPLEPVTTLCAAMPLNGSTEPRLEYAPKSVTRSSTPSHRRFPCAPVPQSSLVIAVRTSAHTTTADLGRHIFALVTQRTRRRCSFTLRQTTFLFTSRRLCLESPKKATRNETRKFEMESMVTAGVYGARDTWHRG